MDSIHATKKRNHMCKLIGASLLEAIIAGLLFLIVFSITMELLPYLARPRHETLFSMKLDFAIEQILTKYMTGVWPNGIYSETYEWGEISIRIEPYRDYSDMQVIVISTHSNEYDRPITHMQIIECRGNI